MQVSDFLVKYVLGSVNTCQIAALPSQMVPGQDRGGVGVPLPPCVMMYDRFPLPLRQVEDLLHERGIYISYETIPFVLTADGWLIDNALALMHYRPHDLFCRHDQF